MTRTFEFWTQTPRFVRNAAVSLPTFLIDLGLLYLLVQHTGLPYLAATIVAFLASNVLSYFLVRRLVFAETERGLKTGLVYFLAIAGFAVLALTGVMWLFVSVLHINIILGRIIAAVVVGTAGYLLNLLVNFRVAGTQRTSRLLDKT